jgi:hypothetical protein
MVNDLNQILIGVAKVKRPGSVPVSFGFLFERYAVQANSFSPLIDILGTPDHESEMI